MMVAVNLGLAAANALLKKILDGGLNHLVIVAYRQVIATIFLAPIAYFWERKSRPKLTVPILCQLFFSALMGVTLAQYFFLLGFEYTTAAFSCAFINIVPVSTFLLALPFRLEKLNMKSLGGRSKVLGAIVCIGGALTLTLYKGKPFYLGATNHMTNHVNTMNSSKKADDWAIGSIVLIAFTVVWSSWFLIQARIGKKYPCKYSSTAIMALFGAIQSAVLSLIVERNPAGWAMKGKLEIITIIYSGVVGSGLCYVGMAWCVEQRGPVFTSAFTPLIQIFVAIVGFFILHEQIYLGSVSGSIIVVIGLYILLWGKSKEIDECQEVNQAQLAPQDGHFDAVSPSHVIPVTMDSSKP